MFSEGKALVLKDSVFYMINKDGHRIFPEFTCTDGFPFQNGLARISINNKWRLIDEYGFNISSDKLDFIEEFKNGYAKIHFRERYGLVDLNGAEIFETRYNLLQPIRDKLYKLESGDGIAYFRFDQGWIWPLTK